jgi:UV DNA damage endonuclease
MTPASNGHIRFGLCCTFSEQPIQFRTSTLKHALSLSVEERLKKLARLCLHNAGALKKALEYCHLQGIGDFRVNSQILPLKSHALAGYDMAELPDGESVVHAFHDCGRYARARGLRLSLHSDQFILLSSPDRDVTERSIAELSYHADVAGWIGVDLITIHGGGSYGDKKTTLDRVRGRLRQLPSSLRSKIALENDDRVYTFADLLPVCREAGVPLVYDVHYHRCLGDTFTVEDATLAAIDTWDREPMFYISSPLNGWRGPDPRRHHAYIDPADFPQCWLHLDRPVTVEVEAKAKEKAVLALKAAFS